MNPEKCRIDECDQASRARGLCNKHYKAETRAGRREAHPFVIPPPLTYKRAHRRVTNKHGSAAQFHCVACAEPADEWSYRGGAPDELRTENGWRYSGDPGFYEPRCISCHRQRDRELREEAA